MSDKIIKFGKSIIQHGIENDRVYLMKLSKEDLSDITEYINTLTDKFGYTKVFAKVPSFALPHFEHQNYLKEAFVPQFFNNTVGCFFMSKFLTEQRQIEKQKLKVQEIIDVAVNKKTASIPELPFAYSVKKMEKKDVEEMACLYSTVFKTYPFPINDEKYLLNTMDDNVVYFGVWCEQKLVALSSCELYCEQSNAEMTDFATLPEYRGMNLSLSLLNVMENELRTLGIATAYTIARAYSFGMNITFAKTNYTFAGTLTNNTNISGNIESMNVWYKSI